MKLAVFIGLLLFLTIFFFLTYDDLKHRKMKIPLSDTLDPSAKIVDARKHPLRFWLLFILQCLVFLFVIGMLIKLLMTG